MEGRITRPVDTFLRLFMGGKDSPLASGSWLAVEIRVAAVAVVALVLAGERSNPAVVCSLIVRSIDRIVTMRDAASYLLMVPPQLLSSVPLDSVVGVIAVPNVVVIMVAVLVVVVVFYTNTTSLTDPGNNNPRPSRRG
jgi:hypothetical protein